MSFTFDSTIGAYTGSGGFAVYDKPENLLESLSYGFTAETENNVFFSASGNYAKYLIAAASQGGSVSMSALSGMINQLLSFRLKTTKRTDGKNLTPVIEYKPGTEFNLSFSKLYYSPGLGCDGFVHNATGANGAAKHTVGMACMVLVDPEYKPVVSKAPAIINSWPQNDKAKPAIQKALVWLNERRNAFAGPDAAMAWVFINGNKCYFSYDDPKARYTALGVEYPYISIDAGGLGKVTLPFWCPLGATHTSLQDEGIHYRTTPFLTVKGKSYDTSPVGNSTTNNHFKNISFQTLESLSETGYSTLRSFFGSIMWPELITEHTRRNGRNHGSYTADINNLGNIVFNQFTIKDEGEEEWSHDAGVRRSKLDQLSKDTSYEKAGIFTGFAPEGIVGITQWTMLYGMFSAVGDWKRGVKLESLFLSGPRIGFSKQEPLVELATALSYDISDTFV